MEENMQGESSMDEKAFLLQEIRYSKRKQNVKKFLRYESTGIAAGGTIAMVLEGCAVFVPFYTIQMKKLERSNVVWRKASLKQNTP
jgi:hypothetical protein